MSSSVGTSVPPSTYTSLPVSQPIAYTGLAPQRPLRGSGEQQAAVTNAVLQARDANQQAAQGENAKDKEKDKDNNNKSQAAARHPDKPSQEIPSAAPLNSHLPVSSRSSFQTFILSQGVFEVEKRFVMKEVIGQGAYGIVCSAFDLLTQRLIAIKKIENVFDHRSLAKRTLRELKILRQMQHENILGIERVMRPHNHQFNNIYLVCDLMETDLACVIRSPQELSDEHVQFFIYQVLRGLKYIHSANVIHRDLKPRNLLVNSNCDLKLCDFGLARVDSGSGGSMSNYVATRWYRAPELLISAPNYGKAVDMWSVGCILAELIGRKPIFPGRDSFHQLQLICQVLGPPTLSFTPPAPNTSTSSTSSSSNPSQNVTAGYLATLTHNKVPFSTLYPQASPAACDLLEKLLCFNPDDRITVEDALRHPYLQELHCEDDEPVCTGFDHREFKFETKKVTKEELRALIHSEITDHYPEENFDLSSKQSVLDSFVNSLSSSLPKGKRTRRKSI